MFNLYLASSVVFEFSLENCVRRYESGVLMSDEEIWFVEFNINRWWELFEIENLRLEQ